MKSPWYCHVEGRIDTKKHGKCVCIYCCVYELKAYTFGIMEQEINHAHSVLDEHDTHKHHTRKRGMTNKKIGIAVALLIIIGVVGYWYVKGNPFTAQYPEGLPEQLREGVRGYVAEVNGEKIPRKSFNEILAVVAGQAVLSGADFNDENTRNEMKRTALTAIIDNTILLQAARESGATVDEKKVDEQVLSVSLQIGGEEKFAEELKKAGLTEEKYRESVRDQLMLDTYIEQTVDKSAIEITESAMRSFYDERIKTAPKGTEIPKFNDSKELITDFLRNQRFQELVIAHIESLRNGAEVKKILIIPEPEQSSEQEVTTTTQESE